MDQKIKKMSKICHRKISDTIFSNTNKKINGLFLMKITRYLFLSAILLTTINITGCMDKDAKIYPNHWNCRQDDSSELGRRLEKLEHEGKIANASEFIEHCQANKLGIFSDEYENLSFSKNYDKDHERLFSKWQKEAIAESGQH